MLCVHRITEYPLGCEDLCGLDSGNDEGLVAARSQLGMLSLLHLYLLSSPLVLNFDVDTPNNIWSGYLVALLHSHKQASKQPIGRSSLPDHLILCGDDLLSKDYVKAS